MTLNMDEWFEGLDAETAEPQAFGFEDGETEATLTDVSLFESKSSSWTAVQFEFTDKDGNTDNGYRVSISKKKTDGSKQPVKMWQRSVFQLMRPLLLANPKYKAVVDLETINQGNAAVVEALQVLVDKLPVRIEKTTPEAKNGETAYPEYTFLKPLEF